jgi:hypothetical protein
MTLTYIQVQTTEDYNFLFLSLVLMNLVLKPKALSGYPLFAEMLDRIQP